MSKPDAELHNPNPEYLRNLIGLAGLSQRAAARKIGVGERAMRQYLADRNAKTAMEVPYPTQYCLEQLAKNNG